MILFAWSLWARILQQFLLITVSVLLLLGTMESLAQAMQLPLQLGLRQLVTLIAVSTLQMSSLFWPGLWILAISTIWHQCQVRTYVLTWQSLGWSAFEVRKVFYYTSFLSFVCASVIAGWFAPWALQQQMQSFASWMQTFRLEREAGVFQNIRLGSGRKAVYYFPKQNPEKADSHFAFINVSRGERAVQVRSKEAQMMAKKGVMGVSLDQGRAYFMKQAEPEIELAYKTGWVPIKLPHTTLEKRPYALYDNTALWRSLHTPGAQKELIWRSSLTVAVITLTGSCLLLWPFHQVRSVSRYHAQVGILYAGFMLAMVMLKTLDTLSSVSMLTATCLLHVITLLSAAVARRLQARE